MTLAPNGRATIDVSVTLLAQTKTAATVDVLHITGWSFAVAVQVVADRTVHIDGYQPLTIRGKRLAK